MELGRSRKKNRCRSYARLAGPNNQTEHLSGTCNHTTLISVEEYEKAKKRQRQQERQVRISNRKIQEKQDIAMRVAQERDKERNEMNTMNNEDDLSHLLRKASLRPESRDERRMLQIRYYKKLYPTAYSY